MRINRAIISTGLLFAALSTAGCQQSEAPPAADEQRISTGPEAKPGLSVSGGQLILPVVSGNPAAAYFTVSNNAAAPVTMAGAYIEGAASAEFHETEGGSMRPVDTVAIEAGKEFVFEPGGNHVMIFDLDESLIAGGTTEMTLTFEGGDKISAPLAIESRGGAEN